MGCLFGTPALALATIATQPSVAELAAASLATQPSVAEPAAAAA